MKFDPNEYETVKSRKERFYKDNKDGRIIVNNITPAEKLMEFSLYRVEIYLSAEDQEKGLPRATGTAMEIRDTELKISGRGSKYESVNYTSWTENCEESAVGRALDNAGYSGNKKASREEMYKAKRMATTINKTPTKYVKQTASSEARKASAKQVKFINTLISNLGKDRDAVKEFYKVKSMNDLTLSQASELIENLNNQSTTVH